MLLLFELHDPPRNVDGHRTRLDVPELLDRLKTIVIVLLNPVWCSINISSFKKLLDKYQWVFSVINLHYAIKDILNTQIYYFDWRGWVLIPVDATVLELLGRWLLESRRLDKIQFQVQVLLYSLWSGHLQGGFQEEPPGLPGRSTWRRCPCCPGDCPDHQPRWVRTSLRQLLWDDLLPEPEPLVAVPLVEHRRVDRDLQTSAGFVTPACAGWSWWSGWSDLSRREKSLD